MPYHEWGDDWFRHNGDELYRAEAYIHNFVEKYGFASMDIKEKYGTLRYSYIYPKLPHSWAYSSKLKQFIYYKIAIKWAHFVFGCAIMRAVKKFPSVKPEILSGYRK